MNLPEIVDHTKAYYCLDCGICTGSCPVSRVTPDFSPRLMVEKVLMDEEESPLDDVNVWSCLSCGQCSCAMSRENRLSGIRAYGPGRSGATR